MAISPPSSSSKERGTDQCHRTSADPIRAQTGPPGLAGSRCQDLVPNSASGGSVALARVALPVLLHGAGAAVWRREARQRDGPLRLAKALEVNVRRRRAGRGRRGPRRSFWDSLTSAQRARDAIPLQRVPLARAWMGRRTMASSHALHDKNLPEKYASGALGHGAQMLMPESYSISHCKQAMHLARSATPRRC